MLTGFILTAAAISAITVAIIAPALLGRRRPADDDHDQHNIAAARHRLAELTPAAGAATDSNTDTAADSDSTDTDTDSDATTAADARAEIELALLDDLRAPPAPTPTTVHRAWAPLLLALLPVAAVVLYLALGSPDALRDTRPPPLAQLLQQLEQKLAADPTHAEGWALAGQTYLRLGQYQQAERAFTRLHGLRGDTVEILTAIAGAARLANGGTFPLRSRAHLRRALELDPSHPTALWLAALQAQSRGRYERAMSHLARLLPQLQPEQEAYAAVLALIAELQRAGVE